MCHDAACNVSDAADALCVAAGVLCDVSGAAVTILVVAPLLNVSRVRERDCDLVLARNLSISPLAAVPRSLAPFRLLGGPLSRLLGGWAAELLPLLTPTLGPEMEVLYCVLMPSLFYSTLHYHMY